LFWQAGNYPDLCPDLSRFRGWWGGIAVGCASSELACGSVRPSVSGSHPSGALFVPFSALGAVGPVG